MSLFSTNFLYPICGVFSCGDTLILFLLSHLLKPVTLLLTPLVSPAEQIQRNRIKHLWRLILIILLLNYRLLDLLLFPLLEHLSPLLH